jgi:glutaminyl-tRNA synthetase
MTAFMNPAETEGPTRTIPFSKELYIERDDFMENPPKKYFRLQPGGEVRLKYSYIIKCEEVIKDAEGNVTEIRCTYDPTSRPGGGEWRSVKGTIHWVSVEHAKTAQVRLFDRLFTEAEMDSIPEDKQYTDFLNPHSLDYATGYCEPALFEDNTNIAIQFERIGYFIKDSESSAENPVFNRTVGLKSAW